MLNTSSAIPKLTSSCTTGVERRRNVATCRVSARSSSEATHQAIHRCVLCPAKSRLHQVVANLRAAIDGLERCDRNLPKPSSKAGQTKTANTRPTEIKLEKHIARAAVINLSNSHKKPPKQNLIYELISSWTRTRAYTRMHASLNFLGTESTPEPILIDSYNSLITVHTNRTIGPPYLRSSSKNAKNSLRNRRKRAPK